MAWCADLAGKAENLLNTIDEQTGSLRNTNQRTKVYNRHESRSEPFSPLKKKPPPLRTGQRKAPEPRSKSPPSAYNQDYQRQSRVLTKQATPNDTLRQRKSPYRRSKSPYDLNDSPKTLVEDFNHEEKKNFRQKGYTPGDTVAADDESLTFRMQNLEIENAMLKNELNVMNMEITELLSRLRTTEEELNKNAETVSRTEDLEAEIKVLRESHKELTAEIKSMQDIINNNSSVNLKLEDDLNQAHTTINELQSQIDKSAEEFKKLESDWKAYRARVKNTIQSKDKEIKSMQKGMNLTEDTKILIEQLECLKEEREDLTEAISRFRSENESMRTCVERCEQTSVQLKEALRAERARRRMCEEEALAADEELKTVKLEYDQLAKSFEMSVKDRTAEVHVLVEPGSEHGSEKTSALTLNVGEYTEEEALDDKKKITVLTDLVLKKQIMIESLTDDYNEIKEQMTVMEEEHALTNRRLRDADEVIFKHIAAAYRKRHNGANPPNDKQKRKAKVAVGYSSVGTETVHLAIVPSASAIKAHEVKRPINFTTMIMSMYYSRFLAVYIIALHIFAACALYSFRTFWVPVLAAAAPGGGAAGVVDQAIPKLKDA